MLRPTAKEIEVMDDYKILIKFDNGEKKMFDASGLLSKKPFKPLNNKAIFQTVRPNGITIEWIGDIDIDPDDLYYGSTSID
jgi:hypothetical protein